MARLFRARYPEGVRLVYLLGADGPEDIAPALLAALCDLPQRTREGTRARYWLDLPERETADVMGVSPGTV